MWIEVRVICPVCGRLQAVVMWDPGGLDPAVVARVMSVECPPVCRECGRIQSVDTRSMEKTLEEVARGA